MNQESGYNKTNSIEKKPPSSLEQISTQQGQVVGKRPGFAEVIFTD